MFLITSDKKICQSPAVSSKPRCPYGTGKEAKLASECNVRTPEREHYYQELCAIMRQRVTVKQLDAFCQHVSRTKGEHLRGHWMRYKWALVGYLRSNVPDPWLLIHSVDMPEPTLFDLDTDTIFPTMDLQSPWLDIHSSS